MSVGRTWRIGLLMTGESGLLVAAVAASAYLRMGQSGFQELTMPSGLLKVLLIVGVLQVCLSYSDLYELRTLAGTRDVLLRLLQALGATSLILAGVYLVLPQLIIARGVFAMAVAMTMCLVVMWRITFAWLSHHAGPHERLLIVGTSQSAIELSRELMARRQELGVDIVGFVNPDDADFPTPSLKASIVGSIEDIPRLIPDLQVDRVVVSLADARGKLPMAKLLEARIAGGVAFDHLASVYEEYTGKIAVENLRPSWLIFSAGFRKSPALKAAKRTMDIIAAGIGLLLTAPLMAIVAVLVKMTPGPVLYHQERVGLNGRIFTVHKFRTMRQDAEKSTGPVWSTLNDNRVTPIGKFLRRVRLDELPQLWNVFVGEMSLIGPRPERPAFVAQLSEAIPFYSQRHVIKPGLTGWAQVRYTYGASVEDAIEKLQYDLYYIKHVSIGLDIAIVIDTIKTVLLGRGAR